MSTPASKQRPTAEVRTGQAPPAPVAFSGVVTQTVAVDLPWCETNGYVPRFLQGRVSVRQGAVLRVLQRGLIERGEKVHSATDAVRKLLDLTADRLGLSPTGEAPKR